MEINYKDDVLVTLGKKKTVKLNDRLNAYVYTKDNAGNKLPERIVALQHVDFDRVMYLKESSLKDIAKLLK